MKRLLFSTLLLLLAVVSRATITFSVDNVKLQRSESIELPVNVTNDEAFAGFEMRIILPQGVSFKGAATNERVAATSRLEGFTITGADQSDGSFKICVVNLLGTPIAAGKGTLLKLLLKTADDAPYQEGELTLGTVRYSKDEVLHNVDDVVSKIKVYTNYTITTATADANMGTVSEGASVESATLFTVTATPVNGYDFVAWKDGETIVSTDAEYEFTPTKDQMLTAYFEPHVFKATFKSWGTTTPVNVAFGATIEAPTAAAKTGYSFSKWDPEVPETMPASNLEFNAQYTADPYALTYDLKGGALAGDVTNPASYTIESETFTLNNPTKEGYTFVGWTGTDLAEATMEVTIAKGSMGARSFTAQWQINQYTMTFKLENGEADVVKTQDYATTLTAPEPTREGYTFKGWDAEVPATIPAADKTFTAQWQINQYTMTFKLENGEADVTIKQDYATALTAPAEPTREGYTFKGWDAEVPATIPAADKTFTAQWQINQYTMTFKLENGEADVTIKQDYATALTAPADPTREGYTFKGWDAEVPATIPASDKTFTAQWQINQYTMTFKLENGEADVVKTQDYATALTAPEPTKEGYTFKGWDAEVPATIPASDKTFTAQWQINQYTMTFKLENGEADVVKTQDYATALTAPEPTKEGYTFKGWDAEVPATIPAADKIFTAQWQINQYTMTFKLENGEADVVKTQDYATALTAPEPTKEGYTFKGWDAEVPAMIPASDKTFTAQWQINQYTMTFKLENGEADVVKTQDYATALTAPEPTREGYTFKGWDAEVPATIPASDKTFTAQWQINQYTMTFKLENGEADVVKTRDYATELTAPEPTREGYTFKGWDAEVPATIPAFDKTFTAQWQINQYTMTFKLENGEADVVKTQDYATELTAPEPTREGYTFKGWDAEVPATIPASDKTFTAQWQINQYTMTFKLENGEADVTIKQDYATALTAPADPTREGYTFKGWDAEVPATIPASDKTFTAQWQINQYTMTFKLGNGEADVVKTQDYATALTAPEPTREGYTFKGWDAEVPATIPAADKTFTAQWQINQYTMTFKLENGEADVTIKQDYATALTAPADPTREGYTFKGWDAEVPATIPASDKTFTAQWQINQYSMTFKLENGEADVVKKQDYATELTAPANPTRTGFTFKGWDAEVPATIPAADKTFTAQWQINQYTMTFKLENGEEEVTIKQDYATALTAPVDPTKEGYTFKGWDAEVPATIPAADKTFAAQWQINQYTMTFKLENGEADVVKTQDYATALTAPADPTKEGYTFKGWDAEVPATIPAADKTFTAQWERNSYKLLFIVDGSTFSEQTVPFESQIAMPENPAKEGYTFKGWTPEVPATMPAEDVTVTAEFTVNTYKIRYYLGETLLFEDEVAYGAPVVLREFEGELPEGYSFTQWEGDTFETMPAHDISYRALIVDAIRSIRSDAVGIEVWTLSGARVGRFNSVVELKQLRAGIYIINGKKVRVK